MPVSLTEAAARHVTRYLSKRGKGVGVRLGVKTTGCSGLAYKLEYVDDVAPEDVVFENHGVKDVQLELATQGGRGRAHVRFLVGDVSVPILSMGRLLREGSRLTGQNADLRLEKGRSRRAGCHAA